MCIRDSLSDESTFTVPDTYRQMQVGAIRRLGIKIPRTGFTLSKKLVHLAEMNDMPVQISTQAETDLDVYKRQSGIRMTYEIYKQLQGKVDNPERQLKNVHRGLSQTFGGPPQIAACMILGNELG